MKKIIILGHSNPDVDSIVSGYILNKILEKKGYEAEFIIPDKNIEQDTLDICNKYGLDVKKYKKDIELTGNNQYILVDHNNRNIKGEIICIIDHHPTNETINIKHYYNKKISSTACLIGKENETLLDINDMKLIVIATIIDTVSFHSTKSRKEDEEWVKKICHKYKFNYEELYKEGLRLTPLNEINKITLNGLKKHTLCNKEIHSSYIQLEHPEKENKKINEIINNLKKYIIKNNIYGFVFIVQNMKLFKTTYYFITNYDIYIKKYDNYESRGSTIIPDIEKYISNNLTKK